MRPRIESSSTVAIAPLAALLAVLAAAPATAGDVVVNPDPNAAQCGVHGETCARISGHIRAGAEFPDFNGERTARFLVQPRALAHDPGHAGLDAPGAGMGFLKVSGDDGAR